jgi:DNA-binding IclR family transcriptional regulator
MRYNRYGVKGMSFVKSSGDLAPRTSSVQSIERAISILKAFSMEKEELGVTELSHQLNLHKSTVSRLLTSLRREGLVEENMVTRKYRLGMALVTLGGLVLQRLDLTQAARPLMHELCSATQETVILAIKDGCEAVNVAQVPSPQIVKHIEWIGRRTPLHCTAVGKVLLAYAPAAEREAIIKAGLAGYTSRTLTGPDALCQELGWVREHGYAVGQEEFETGLNSVAAPVRDHTGDLVASISVSGPAFRMASERLPSIAEQAQGSARALSEQLGYRIDAQDSAPEGGD